MKCKQCGRELRELDWKLLNKLSPDVKVLCANCLQRIVMALKQDYDTKYYNATHTGYERFAIALEKDRQNAKRYCKSSKLIE